MSEAQTLEGIVETVRYQAEESGWAVLSVRAPDGLATITGVALGVDEGCEVLATGAWTDNRRFGPQFEASSIVPRPPVTRDGLKRYLEKHVDGVGGHYAESLLDAFGAEGLVAVLDERPEEIRAIKGIGEERSRKIQASWNNHKAFRELLLFLHDVGLGSRAADIQKRYGDEAIGVVRSNPYLLAEEIPGVGFKTADGVAQRVGMAQDSPERIGGALRYLVGEQAERQGHCAQTREGLAALAAEMLTDVTREQVEAELQQEIDRGRLLCEPIGGVDLVYLPVLRFLEQDVAERLLGLGAGSPPWDASTALGEVDAAEQRAGIRLSASQRAAVDGLLGHKLSCLCGGPGSGKSTLQRIVVDVLDGLELRLALAAPTGKAARRLEEASGRQALTLHRLLGVKPGGGFARDADNPLPIDCLVVDEASMIDLRLFRAVLAAIPPEAALILVGDGDQLPPVGPGRVFEELIESPHINVCRLTEIHRQAAQSQIITNAHRINAGDMPVFEPGVGSDFVIASASGAEDAARKTLRLVTRLLPERFGLDPLKDIQVLAPMRKTAAGIDALNRDLQAALNPKGPGIEIGPGMMIRAGDRVVQTRNNYETEVFNGNTGRVESIDAKEKKAWVIFDGRTVVYESEKELRAQLALAYALSVHKSQGSEYPAIVVPVVCGHAALLSRRLLYTAVTRGRQLVVLVGEARAIALAVHNALTESRITGLGERLQSVAGEMAQSGDLAVRL